MTTFTLITWIAAIAIFIWLTKTLFSDLWQVNNGAEALAIITMIWLIIVFGITAALVKDIYHVALTDSMGKFFTWWIVLLLSPETSLPAGISKAQIFFIAGLVALGICSLAALAINVLRGRNDYYYESSGASFGTVTSYVIQGIGLIGSILGIIAFYLDYMN